MPSRLADRLRAARHYHFVGREQELDLFQSALTSEELPFFVMFIFGPGGVGKSTLLREYIQVCDTLSTPVAHLDTRNVEPSPANFYNALGSALGSEPGTSPLTLLAERSGRQVILIDTYETLAPLDEWIRGEFLPQLPDHVLTVLAGRESPSKNWRADAGWLDLIRVVPLRNLNPEESRLYLTKRRVPEEQHRAALDFTHGHPLALSLIADTIAQRPGAKFHLEVSPDIVRTLLEQFAQKVPGPAHRAALESCSLVRVTTETLLAEMLDMPDAHELFEWLRGLSFVESRPGGLFPHDLAREALAADLRWRNPDWYAELHRRARTYYIKRLDETIGLQQQRALWDYIFLHRDNPIVRPFFEWQASGSILADHIQDADIPALVAMVKTHEGEASATIASHWLQAQPEGVTVFRDADRDQAGFLSAVELTRASNADLKRDPATQAVWDYIQTHAPLRSGEMAAIFRFWMAADSYQEVSAIQSLIFVNIVRYYLTSPGLAITLIPCASPDFWADVFAYGDLDRLPEADFEVGGRRYGVYGHDWRKVPPMAWLELLGEREVATGLDPRRHSEALSPLVVLSAQDFARAVQEALKNLLQPDLLIRNPLLRSRLVVEHAGMNSDETERVGDLIARIRETIDQLDSNPRDRKYHRVLYHSFLQPAPTQERAAEILDLPFSTYRRHLKASIHRVTELLWNLEISSGDTL